MYEMTARQNYRSWHCVSNKKHIYDCLLAIHTNVSQVPLMLTTQKLPRIWQVVETYTWLPDRAGMTCVSLDSVDTAGSCCASTQMYSTRSIDIISMTEQTAAEQVTSYTISTVLGWFHSTANWRRHAYLDAALIPMALSIHNVVLALGLESLRKWQHCGMRWAIFAIS